MPSERQAARFAVGIAPAWAERWRPTLQAYLHHLDVSVFDDLPRVKATDAPIQVEWSCGGNWWAWAARRRRTVCFDLTYWARRLAVYPADVPAAEPERLAPWADTFRAWDADGCLRGVALHELCHLYRSGGHGAGWQRLAERVGACWHGNKDAYGPICGARGGWGQYRAWQQEQARRVV